MIRKMELEDTARVSEICVLEWRDAYRGIISDYILFEKIRISQRTTQFEACTNNPFQENYVYDEGSSIKAFLINGPCRNEDKPGAYEIWCLYVDHFMHNQGIGTQLIAFGEARARACGYSEVVIWTLEENSHARTFYENRGYATDGTIVYIQKYRVNEIRYCKKLI